ncbi:hypothetical protein BO94DRAFT_533979, partial [Aspergillus sclerotioniger CBS 115572]
MVAATTTTMMTTRRLTRRPTKDPDCVDGLMRHDSPAHLGWTSQPCSGQDPIGHRCTSSRHPTHPSPLRLWSRSGRDSPAAIGLGQIGQSASDAATDMELERTTVRISGYSGLVADGTSPVRNLFSGSSQALAGYG